MAITYYPRLSDAYTMMLIGEYSSKTSPNELTAFAQTSHEMAFYDAKATERASDAQLAQLRDKLMNLAVQAGFPEPLARGKVRDFDQPASDILFSEIDLLPSEAANQEIWNFLTLILLPDIAAWRYPNSQKKPDFERWLGTDRNVFRKLWWREVTLGKKHNTLVGEDEAVGIMERPSLSSNPNVARAIVTAFDSVYKDFPDLGRTGVMRAVMVSVRRLLPLIDFEFYSEDELAEFLKEVAYAACVAYAERQKIERGLTKEND
ncbi:DUF6339 family protein [uncultured Corynebacterium sp.]|uniref:DUF6339 family protein n=1 Tax=uncultured Corynebacterium sp. TaxID=159447 RepID=UPI0025FA79B9|nr:DUF6339 family protein [uncultured Corynebacterium sp.]